MASQVEMDDSTANLTSSLTEENSAAAMGDVSSKKRKIDSDSSDSDESKKPRTTEAEIHDEVASPAVMMAEKPPMMGEGDGNRSAEVVNSVVVGVEKGCQDAKDNDIDEMVSDNVMVAEVIESPQVKTNDAGDKNHMAVDVVPENAPAAESVSSDNANVAIVDLPATTVQSLAADVIDVDAIDSCDEAQKEKSFGNPIEQGLNEYFLKPTAVDSPAANVIDVDAEPLAVTSNNQVVMPESATPVIDKPSASNLESEKSSKNVEEKSCANEMSEVSGEPNNITSDEVSLITDVEAQSGKTVSTSPSTAAEDRPQSPYEILACTSISNQSFEDNGASVDAANASSFEGPNAEPEVACSTEQERLKSAAVDEMFAEMIGQAIAEQECTDSTDKDVVVVVEQAGKNAETDAASPEVEVSAAAKALPTDVSSVRKTVEGFEKPAENVEESGGRGEKVVDLIETSSSEKPTALNEAEAEVDKTGNTTSATDSVNMVYEAGSNTVEVAEMTDKSVSEPANQATEAMDTATATADSESMKEQEDMMDSIEVSLDSEDEMMENIAEVMPTEEMEQTAGDAEKPSEVIDEIDISSEDVKQPTALNERVDTSPSKASADVTAMEAADDTTKGKNDQSKDLTDKKVNVEATGKAVANKDDHISPDTKAPDNAERSQPTAENDHGENTEEIKGAAVSVDTVATDNAPAVVENMPDLKETKHVEVKEDTAENHSVTDCDKLADTKDPAAVDSGTVISAEVSEMPPRDQQCNQETADVTEKVEANGKDITMVNVEHTPAEKACNKVEGIDTDKTELAADETSAVVNEACPNGE